MSALASLRRALKELGLHVLANEPMARHTIIRVGGHADLYVAVYRWEELLRALRLAREHDLPVTIIGGGSNVLVADAGIRGLVISNRLRGWSEEVEGDCLRLTAESGVALAGLALRTVRQGWAGLAWAEGIPGTVGGATVYNAGAFGGTWAERLLSIQAVSPEGEVRCFGAQELAFAYRFSRLQAELAEWVVLAATLQLERGIPQTLKLQLAEHRAQRRRTQPVQPSAGSIFRNPPEAAAGHLVEQVGLKGARRGDAVISPRHANFIVNLGRAQASDVQALMELMQELVWARYGLRLQPEVRLVGEWP